MNENINNTNRYFITAHDKKGNRLFAMVEGHITNEMINHMHNSDNKTALKEIRNLLSNAKQEQEVDHE